MSDAEAAELAREDEVTTAITQQGTLAVAGEQGLEKVRMLFNELALESLEVKTSGAKNTVMISKAEHKALEECRRRCNEADRSGGGGGVKESDGAGQQGD